MASAFDVDAASHDGLPDLFPIFAYGADVFFGQLLGLCRRGHIADGRALTGIRELHALEIVLKRGPVRVIQIKAVARETAEWIAVVAPRHIQRLKF